MTWQTDGAPTRRDSYEKLRDDLLEIQRRIEDIEVTADSADGLVTATVIGRGTLSDLYLDPRIYRTADSKALARSIVDTIGAAVTGAADQLFEITRQYLPPGATRENTDVHAGPFLHQLDTAVGS